MEGGMRVPFIALRPGMLPAGKTCGALATMMDVLPTFAGLAGASANERPAGWVAEPQPLTLARHR
jgi:arylsulfatase A-like enzyme